MVEIGMIQAVQASAKVQEIVGEDIYAVVLPEDFTLAQLPALTYQTIADVDDTYANGGQAISHALIQYDCYSKTYLDNKWLVEYVTAACLGTESTTLTTGHYVIAVEKVNATDLYQTDSRLYRTALEIRVTYSPIPLTF